MEFLLWPDFPTEPLFKVVMKSKRPMKLVKARVVRSKTEIERLKGGKWTNRYRWDSFMKSIRLTWSRKSMKSVSIIGGRYRCGGSCDTRTVMVFRDRYRIKKMRTRNLLKPPIDLHQLQLQYGGDWQFHPLVRLGLCQILSIISPTVEVILARSLW